MIVNKQRDCSNCIPWVSIWVFQTIKGRYVMSVTFTDKSTASCCPTWTFLWFGPEINLPKQPCQGSFIYLFFPSDPAGTEIESQQVHTSEPWSSEPPSTHRGVFQHGSHRTTTNKSDFKISSEQIVSICSVMLLVVPPLNIWTKCWPGPDAMSLGGRTVHILFGIELPSLLKRTEPTRRAEMPFISLR